ncbi:MAG: MarR family winged helix-turn-helix transcriptional regulator [Acidimicrobiales bacterium]
MADGDERTPEDSGVANEHVKGVVADRGQSDAPGITLAGLVFETAGGLRRALSPGIESELGLGGLAFEVLVRLARSPGARLRMTDLAAQTGLTPGGLTRAIDRLVDAGFVCREACPNDRRGAFATLTGLGQERTAEAIRHHERDIATVVADVLDADDIETLITLLRRLRDRVHPRAARVTSDAEDPGAALAR